MYKNQSEWQNEHQQWLNPSLYKALQKRIHLQWCWRLLPAWKKSLEEKKNWIVRCYYDLLKEQPYHSPMMKAVDSRVHCSSFLTKKVVNSHLFHGDVDFERIVPQGLGSKSESLQNTKTSFFSSDLKIHIVPMQIVVN